MERHTLHKTDRKPKRLFAFRSGEKRKNLHSEQFRLSHINVKNRFVDLPNNNQLLFELNKIHNPNFDENKEIELEFLTDELLKGLGNCFNVDPLKFGIKEDFIIVEERLQDDIYEFDIKPFFKLKYKAPILFETFGFFVQNSKIDIIDNQNNRFFDEFSSQTLAEMADDQTENSTVQKEYWKAVESTEISKEKVKELKTCKSKKTILADLQKYKPKNKAYILIKETLINWLELDFSFIYDYPYEYYSEEKNGNDDDEEEEEEEEIYCALSDAIIFKYNSNSLVEESINDSRRDYFDNSTVGTSTACWLITGEKKEQKTKKQIEQFKIFSSEYFSLLDLIQIL